MNMPFDASRRIFLRGASAAAVGIGFGPSPLMSRTAQAATGAKVFVQIFIRGGCDTLNMVVPYGDPTYYNIRGAIAIPRNPLGKRDMFRAAEDLVPSPVNADTSAAMHMRVVVREGPRLGLLRPLELRKHDAPVPDSWIALDPSQKLKDIVVSPSS